MGNFLLGFGLGIVAGILWAPKSGEETRGYIGSKANEGVGYVKRQTQEIRDSAMDAVERGKEVVNRQVEKLASTSQEHAAQVYQR
jgi:gas vesicle protein